MISFRALERGDMPLMHRWLNAAHVVEWWSDEALGLDEIAVRQDFWTRKNPVKHCA